MHRAYLRTIGALVLKRHIHYFADYQRFVDWSAQKRATSKSFYRISYELDRHNHLMMGAPVHNRTPYYKVGYTPAKLFKHVTETTEDPLYRALSVAYVVSQRPLYRPTLTLEARFGSIRVYRFQGYRKERYTLTGPGTVEVKEFSEERIHLKLSGTAPGTRLKVHVANYPRWRARQHGKELLIQEAPAHGSTYPMLMEVGVRDGDLVFEYVTRAADAAGTLLTLLGLGCVVVLLLCGRHPGLARRASSRLGWIGALTARYAGWAALAAAVLLTVGVALRLARGSTGLAESSLANLLPSATVTQAGRPCADRRGSRWFCSRHGWNYVGPTTNMFKGGLTPCIWAHPVDDGPLVISFPGVSLGQALTGHHGLADSAVDGFPGGAPVRMDVRINGQLVQTLTRPSEKGWIGFRVDTARFAGKRAAVSLTISSTKSAGRHYCFDMGVER